MNARRVSAYGRIDENRRATVLLLLVFTALLIPVLAFLTAYLGVWLILYVLPGEGSIQAWLGAQALAVALLAGLIGARVIRMRGALPTILGAKPLSPEAGAPLTGRLANLSLGAGLPAPRLLILRDAAANAFACGPDPQRASLVLTTGLVETLGPREIDGVLAHELAHIANGDIRLNSTVAAILSAARLPAPIYWVILFGAGLGVVLVPGLLIGAWRDQFEAAWLGLTQTGDALEGVPPLARPFVWMGLFGTLVGLPITLIWPLAGRLLQAAVTRRREHLADAEAVRLTRDPMGLASALTRIGAAGGRATGWRVSRKGSAIAHLCIAPLGTGPAGRLFPTHPPIARRVALLEAMGAPEPLPLASEAPVAAFIAAARSAGEQSLAGEGSEPGAAFATGALVGWALRTTLFVLSLGRLAGDPAPGAAALIFATPFGLAGAAAAYAAMSMRRRFYWWPIVVMFVAGPYLPLTLAAGLKGGGVGALILAYLAALTEPLAGAALGALASMGFGALVARASQLSRGR